jgi:hypothetical protein
MENSRSNRSDAWQGQPPEGQAASGEFSWGEGAASALESLKKREQHRDHSHLRHDHDHDDQHPQAQGGDTAGGS